MRELRQVPSLIGITLLSCFVATGCKGNSSGDDDGTIDAAQPDASTGPDADVVPAFRNAVDTPDETLAKQALKLMGEPSVGGAENCNKCHTLIGPRMREWSEVAKQAMDTCLTDLQIASADSAKKMLECLRVVPDDGTAPYYSPARLGPLATAAQLGWFKYAFHKAYGADWETKFNDFRMRVLMPQGNHPAFTQAEFDVVAEWFLRGVPQVDNLIKDEPATADCTESITPDLVEHVNKMKTEGWGAVDLENGMLMFGCPPGTTDPKQCLTSYHRDGEDAYSTNWSALPHQTLRVLRENAYHSSYWTRSSADGRFVGHGARSNTFNSAIVDLKTDTVIPVSALYDPGFFPDNKGFMFQDRDQAYACDYSVLTAGPTAIHLDEPGCAAISQNQVGLYQYIGTAPGNGDYWTVSGSFNSDNGAQRDPTFAEPDADFRSTARVYLTPMVHTGTTFSPGETLAFPAAHEGDFSMSPSSQLIVSRLAGPDAKMKAFVIHKVNATRTDTGGYTAEIPEVGRFCMRGAKPSFSFDERWMVLHHYVDDDAAVNLGFSGPNDPGFAAYKQSGAANVFLVDMLTGARTRITTMHPGQYALYPHFRADGWIYFVVRSLGTTHEYIVASDAALVLQQH
jgi:hypothetical protein